MVLLEGAVRRGAAPRDRSRARWRHGRAAMNGAGRIRTRARRAMIAHGGQATTRQVMSWIWPKRSTFRSGDYERARKALRAFCEPVRYERRGRFSRRPGGLLWRAVGPIERARTDRPMTGRLWWQKSDQPV